MFHRELAGTYLLVGGSLLGGLLIGVFVIDAQPAILGWLFGAGAGISFGAFVATISSGDQLIGRRMSPPGALPAGDGSMCEESADEDEAAGADHGEPTAED